MLASAVGGRVRLVHTQPSGGFTMTRVVGLLLRDLVLTREEVDGLSPSFGCGPFTPACSGISPSTIATPFVQ